MLVIARQVAKAARAASGLSARVPAARMSSGLDKKEMAEEKRYFNAEEEKLLRKLAARARQEHKATPSGMAVVDAETAALDRIIGKYSISAADKQALIAWRHSHDF